MMDFDIQPDLGDGLYEPCLVAHRPVVEIPVTDEMIAAGLAASPVVALRNYEVAAMYRAMAAATPTEQCTLTAVEYWAGEYAKAQHCIMALEAIHGPLPAQAVNEDQEKAIYWQQRALAAEMKLAAPTELYREDERRIDVLVARVAELEAESNVWNAVYGNRPDSLFSARQKIAAERDEALTRVAELEELLSAFQFPASMPADLPDPPRRPDGTLAPAAKSWSPPKTAGDARRIGG